MRLWEATNGNLLATLRGHASEILGVALSRDGRLLASAGFDGTPRLWEVPGGRLLAALEGHSGAVWSVSLNGDGGLLASGGFDGTARIWETSSGAHLRTLRRDRRYEGLDITGPTGVTAAQRTALVALGAVER